MPANGLPSRPLPRARHAPAPALALATALALGLSGCINLGGDPPESLLTLSPAARAPVGAGLGSAGERPVIAVLAIETPAKLDVLRVPVAVTPTELAYLPGAFWVEKPARLFRRLLGETIRARSTALVLDADDTALIATRTLRGTLTEMGYDAASGAVVVRFDAVRIESDGTLRTRRFEASERAVAGDYRTVGAALNEAANRVAAGVAEWVGE